MRTARSALFFCLTVLAGVLVVAAFLPGVARADTVSFSVQGQNFSFDTGDGRDGNVELRLKAGDASKVEVVVNGSVKATLSPPSQTVYKNVMELDGRPLEQRSNLSYRPVNMEDIVPYLPATKSYSPSPSTSAVSTGNALYSYTSSANQDISKEWSPAAGLTVRRVRFKGYNYSYTSGSSTVYCYNYLYALVDGSWVLVAQRRQSYDEWITLPRGATRIKTRLTTGASSYSGTWVDGPEAVPGFPVEGPPASLGTVPQFNNLTVGQGVMLTANSHVAFKVKGTLTVKGMVMSRHGAGGAATSPSNVDGADAAGDVVIMAANIVVAPDGATGASGAILGGWGGGGGAYTNSTPGKGGSGASVYLYAGRVVNRGEIRAGNGGGGGAYSYGDSSSGVNVGGFGGDTVLVAATLEGGGVVASGLSGTNGGNYSSNYGIAGAGYGGGGKAYYDDYNSRWVNGPGGTGGQPGANGGGAGFGGKTGYYGNITVGYSRSDGRLVVKAGRLQEIPGIEARFLVGYSDGGWTGGYSYSPSQLVYTGVRARKTIWVDAVSGNPAVSIGAGMYIPRDFDRPLQALTVSDSIVFGTPQAPVSLTVKDLFFTSLTVNGDATFTGNLYFVPGVVQVTGRATFAPSSYIYAKCNVPARFAAGRDVEVRANIERTLWTNVQLGYGGWSGDAYESSYASFSSGGGDVRFAGRSDYLNPAWWRQTNSYGDYYRNVVAQGITVSLAVPAVSVSGFGSVCLSLGDYVAKYGYLGSLEFQAERKAEGGAWAQAGPSFVRNLTGSPEWHDVNTPLKQDLYYRLGCRRPGAGTGFFFIDDLVVGPVRSEGSALVDEEPPQVEAFLVNGGVSPATVRYVSAELVAADNRTPADQLLVQFEVNGQKRYFDGSAWQAGDGWGPYRQVYEALDLGQTSGLVKVTVRVKDIAGNVGTAVAQVDLRLEGGYAGGGVVSVAGAVAGAYDGLSVLFVRSEKVTLNLNFPGANHVRFGLDGQPFSEWEAYSAQRVVALPKPSGLVVLTVQARDASRYFAPQKLYLVVDGQPPAITRLRGLNGATATRTSSVTLEIAAADNLPGTLQYRCQVNGGAWSSWANLTGGTIPVSGLASGANRITVEVKDLAGNSTQGTVTLFRL